MRWDGPSFHSPLQKLNFCNSSSKTRKCRYQIFLSLFNITGFLCFVSNISSGTVARHLDLFPFFDYLMSSATINIIVTFNSLNCYLYLP